MAEAKENAALEAGHKDTESLTPFNQKQLPDDSIPPDALKVSWDGPDDPENPKNWPLKRKWAAVLTTASFSLMTVASSSVIAPAEEAIAHSFDNHEKIVLDLIFSIFLLGFVVGPLFLAPLSEIYGRAIVLRLSNLWFTAFTIGCGFAQTTGQMLAFRLLAGVGACGPQSVGGGVLSDCFRSEERGKAVAVYTLGPVLGPSLAPMIGGFITVNTTWRWCFWILAMIGGVVQVGLWFFLPETYPPHLLHLKAKRLRKQNPDKVFQTEFEQTNNNPVRVIQQALIRPVRLVGTQPIVQYLASYMGLLYGITFLMLSTFPDLWTTQYGQSLEIGGLNYIALAIGMVAGSQLSGFLLDWSYRRQKERSSDPSQGVPEYRVPLLFLSTGLTTIGLFLFGWTAEYRVQWVVPDIGAVIFGCGLSITFTTLQSYVIDAYPRYAASALGVTAIARSLAGFGFPLFANSMYRALGWGWGTTIVAFAVLVIGEGGAAILWFFGEKLRRASPYAAG